MAGDSFRLLFDGMLYKDGAGVCESDALRESTMGLLNTSCSREPVLLVLSLPFRLESTTRDDCVAPRKVCVRSMAAVSSSCSREQPPKDGAPNTNNTHGAARRKR